MVVYGVKFWSEWKKKDLDLDYHAGNNAERRTDVL